MDVLTALRRTGLFDSLSEPDLRELAGASVVTRLPSGRVLVHEGEPADAFFVVLDGAVEVFHERGGEQLVVATLDPGAHLGELSLLRNDGRRTASVRAYVDTTLLALDHAALQPLLQVSPDLRRHLDTLADTQIVRSLAHRSLLLRTALAAGVPWTARTRGAGELLFEDGVQADEAWVILEGVVRVVRLERGRERLLRRLLAGQLVGERAALSGGGHTARVRAETDLHLLRLDRASLRRLVDTEPLWQAHIQTLERSYADPQRGVVTQASGRLQGVPTLVCTYALRDGRRVRVERTVGPPRMRIETDGVPLAGAVRFGETRLDLDQDGILRGVDAVARRRALTRLVHLVLDEQHLDATAQARFEREGTLPAPGRA